MIIFLQNCIDGFMIGGFYALFALGFTLMFGVMKWTNLAYGSCIMLGVFSGIWMHLHFQLDLFWIFFVIILITVIAGYYVERLCYRWLPKKAFMAMMVSSFAIWMQLDEIVRIYFPTRSYPFPRLMDNDLMLIGPLMFKVEGLLILVICGLLAGTIYVFLYKTRYGLAMRAVSEDPVASRYVGINMPSILLGTSIIASVIGGIAGFLMASSDAQVSTEFGLWVTYKSIIAMTLAGLGSIRGAVLGGIILGVIEANSLWYLGAEYRDLVSFMLFFIVLVILPGGLLGTAKEQQARAAVRRG